MEASENRIPAAVYSPNPVKIYFAATALAPNIIISITVAKTIKGAITSLELGFKLFIAGDYKSYWIRQQEIIIAFTFNSLLRKINNYLNSSIISFEHC